MIDNKRVIALIPARGGSKSIPRKNLQILGGKPLIWWSIAAARDAPEVDRIIVSTDDSEIAGISASLGAEVYLRPDELAQDSSLVSDTVRHLSETLVLEGEQAEIMVVLEPTCPLRPKGIVSQCLGKLIEKQCDSIATFQELELSPNRIWEIKNEIATPLINGSMPWLPRQALPRGYQLNGAVYAFFHKRQPQANPSMLFGKSAALVMPGKTLDIDTPEDLKSAREKISGKGIGDV